MLLILFCAMLCIASYKIMWEILTTLCGMEKEKTEPESHHNNGMEYTHTQTQTFSMCSFCTKEMQNEWIIIIVGWLVVCYVEKLCKL